MTKVPPTSNLNSAADAGGEPERDPTAYFWYKTTGKTSNSYSLITAILGRRAISSARYLKAVAH